MELRLTDSERVLLRQTQRACWGKAGYVPVTVLLMLDHGHAAATIAQNLDVEASSVYRYAQAYRLQDLVGLLAGEQPGYWGLLTSAQLAGPRRELDQTLYTDCRAIADWLAASYGVRYAVSGLMDLLHRLEFSYKPKLRSTVGAKEVCSAWKRLGLKYSTPSNPARHERTDRRNVLLPR